MNDLRTVNRSYEQLAWGAIFVWWGVTELFTSLPSGTGVLGLGLILLGLNAARSLSGVPTSGFSITLGILALVLGALELSSAILHLPFEVPVFAILLIVLGAIVLVRAVAVNVSQEQGA